MVVVLGGVCRGEPVPDLHYFVVVVEQGECVVLVGANLQSWWQMDRSFQQMVTGRL